MRFLDHTQLHTHTHIHTYTPTHNYTYTPTHNIGFICKSGQLIAEAATCTAHSEYKSWMSVHSAGFEPAIPTVSQLQTYSLGRTATEIDRYYIRTSQYCTAIKKKYIVIQIYHYIRSFEKKGYDTTNLFQYVLSLVITVITTLNVKQITFHSQPNIVA